MWVKVVEKKIIVDKVLYISVKKNAQTLKFVKLCDRDGKKPKFFSKILIGNAP